MHTHAFIVTLLAVAIFKMFIYCDAVFSDPLYQPGFRTIGVWSGEPDFRLDMNIWYPATRQPREINYSPWVLNVALNAKPAAGAFPLLIISHPTPGLRFSYHDLAALLARKGFIVAAPTHGKDNMDNMDSLFTWAQLENRTEDIKRSIDLVLSDKALKQSVAADRIGLIGFGSGGSAALLMGGALPNCNSWNSYCARAYKNDPYCSGWAKERINSMCQNFPLRKSLADPQIKAIAAVAPGFGMIFDNQSFNYFYPALLIAAAGKDSFNRPELHCEPIARILGKKSRYLDLPKADAGALMAPCPPALAEELSELCLSVSEEEKRALHEKFANALSAFFSHYLQNTANLPVIPTPPNL